ncbi:MAG: hypothetical protein AB7F71_24840, partial [Burkholderiaceae bacterium]
MNPWFAFPRRAFRRGGGGAIASMPACRAMPACHEARLIDATHCPIIHRGVADASRHLAVQPRAVRAGAR